MSVPEVIGEGSYGCVHSPSLICGNKKISYKNKISKIMLSKEAVKELKEYAVISKIDKTNEYFTGMPTTCRVKNTAQTVKAINKCKHLKHKYAKNGTLKQMLPKLSLLVMNDGGKDLKMLAAYFDSLQNTSSTTDQIKWFWVEAHRLFRGLFAFQKFGIMHHDVKPQNIVYNTSTQRINYIDFGHMRSVKAEMKKSKQSDNWIYDYAFWNYPFEIQFLNKDEFVNFSNKSIHEKKQFIIGFIDDLKHERDTKFANAFRIFMDYMLRNRTKSEKKTIYNRYIIDFEKTVLEGMISYDAFAKKSIDTIDVYGLGMSLQFMLAYTKRFMNSGIVKQLEDCFFRMTTADVMDRYSVSDAMDAFETCLESAGYASFKNHKPVETNDASVEKTLQKLSPEDISINRLTKKQKLTAMYRTTS